MKKLERLRKTALAAFILAFVSATSPLAQEHRIALVIGNGAYSDSPLKNPVNDAADMASALRELGFEVNLKTDANQRSMKESIRSFGKKLREGGVGLFYFAGHGVQVNGRNYLIPVHGTIESEADVEYEAVDAGRVLAQMENAGNDLNIVILDACRNNPFTRSFRSAAKGLAKMDAPTGSLLAYSTAPGSVAADGTGRNGLYTKYLLKHMRSPGTKLEDIFKQVRIDVIADTGNKQVPWESSSLTGDFFFTASKESSALQVLGRKQYSPELEQERKELEKERQELERIRLEVERKKLEAERQRLEAEKTMLATKERKLATSENHCDKIVGYWKWFNGDNQRIKKDGTIDSITKSFFSGSQLNENTGKWECTDPAHGKFRFIWGGGVWIDTLELSEDGQRLTGFNQDGTKVDGWKQ